MKVRSHGADRESQGFGDLLIALVLLVVEDEDGPLDDAEALQVRFDDEREFRMRELGFGVVGGVGEAVFPTFILVGDGDMLAVGAALAFPLVLRDVDGDAIEVG